MSTSHAQLVGNQFGPRADAYVKSAVHAQGADLDHMVELLRGAATGEVLFQTAGDGFFDVAGTVEFGQWNHFEMVLNYDNGSYSVYVNGQQGRVISQGTNQTHRVVIETHNAAGRSTGTTTLNGYNLAFNRQLKPGTPSYVGLVRNMNDLNRLRHRGF